MRTGYLSVSLALLVGSAVLRPSGYADVRRPSPPAALKVKALSDERARGLWEKGRAREEEGRYGAAASAYRELLRKAPASPFSAEAQYHLASCLENQNDLYEAFLAYQKLLDDYPGHGNLGDILERQFRIGEAYLQGKKRNLLFLPIRSGLGTAAEIFRKVVQNATFSRVAPQAQYDLGLALQQNGDYEQAELEYDLVMKNYPDSEVVGSTIFQIGVCAFEQAQQSDYDQEQVNKGSASLTKFLQDYPADPRRPRAEELLNELLGRQAEKAYDIARYYEGKDSAEGSRIYYQEVVDKFPTTEWAEKAREKLAALEVAGAGSEP